MNMVKEFFSENGRHFIAAAAFIAISFAYFTPVLKGDMLHQPDIANFQGMAKELIDHREKTGEEGLWTNSMFGGMPSYLTTVIYPYDFTAPLKKILNLGYPEPANILFLYMLGFYICALAFGMGSGLAFAAALAFAFSTYFLIIIEAGHVTKAYAIGYMPPIVGAAYMAARGRLALGGLVFAFFLASQLATRHLQITYYTLITLLVLGAALLYQNYRSGQLKMLWKAGGVLAGAAILAAGINFPNLYLINEYGKYSMRGKSELSANKDDQTSGLNKSYATAWSYGKAETGTLLIPNFHGGGASDHYRYSNFHKEYFDKYKAYFMQEGYPPKTAEKVAGQQIAAGMYWGPQPFTSGPVYIGAIVCFLFVLGIFIVPGAIKWWLLAATLISLSLSWGKNLMWLTEFFLDYVPGYNKFRTVSMILVIAEFTMPLLGFLAVNKLINSDVRQFGSKHPGIDKAVFRKLSFFSCCKLNYIALSFIITGGACLFFALFGSSIFSFGADTLSNDQMSADILESRKSIFSMDAWRSLLFVSLGAAAAAALAAGKIKGWKFAALLSVLLLADLWPVNKRYLNDDNFGPKREVQRPFPMTQADAFILRENSGKARVLNVSVNTFNDASTAYYHHSIGGYHGAKMQRYQDLIDNAISIEMQQLMGTLRSGAAPGQIFASLSGANALNMLNTKYLIYNKDAQPIINPHALGSAWLVEKLVAVNNADEEIAAIDGIDPAKEAVYDKKFAGLVSSPDYSAAGSSIEKLKYMPRELIYKANIQSQVCAVFSEIYYPKGWNAYINGTLVPHFRVNYVLRAMILEPGEYEIIFRFEPSGFFNGSKVTFASSMLLILLIIGYIVQHIRELKSKK
jgi:hypothetical protein